MRPASRRVALSSPAGLGRSRASVCRARGQPKSTGIAGQAAAWWAVQAIRAARLPGFVSPPEARVNRSTAPSPGLPDAVADWTALAVDTLELCVAHALDGLAPTRRSEAAAHIKSVHSTWLDLAPRRAPHVHECALAAHQPELFCGILPSLERSDPFENGVILARLSPASVGQICP